MARQCRADFIDQLVPTFRFPLTNQERKGRGTTEEIFILRNIIEQCIEWNASLCACFVDFKKAFDSVDRSVLWRIIRTYSIPEKIVKIVKVMYSGNECAVIDGSSVHDCFEIKTDVKQDCCLGFFSCLLWVMKRKPNMGTQVSDGISKTS